MGAPTQPVADRPGRGEAYIPLPVDPDRSLAILRETARRMGYPGPR